MGALLGWLREADWFDAERARVYPRLFVLIFIPTLAFEYWYALSRHGPVDFAGFWIAGRLALTDPVLSYRETAQRTLQAQFGTGRWLPFIYPPPFLLLLRPLGHLPFALALPLWSALTGGLYFVAARRLVGGWLALAFAPAMISASVGQTGLLVAALFLTAVATLERAPSVSGLLLGALVLKPHLALLVPIALLAGREWKAIAGATLASALILTAAWCAFGMEAYRAWLAALGQQGGRWFDPLVLGKIQSVFVLVASLTGNERVGYLVQGLVTAVTAGAVAWTWRTRSDGLTRGAMLAAGAVLATPYVFSYDTPLLVLPIWWLAREGKRNGFRRWERATIGLAFAAPLFSYLTIRLGLVNIATLANLLLFGALVARVRAENRHGVVANPRTSLDAS
jgi:hypothetical protein